MNLDHTIHVLQVTNTVEIWHQGYDLVYFLALSDWPRQSMGEVTMQVNSFGTPGTVSWVGACVEIVGLFKHFLSVTAHPHFFSGVLSAYGRLSGTIQ